MMSVLIAIAGMAIGCQQDQGPYATYEAAPPQTANAEQPMDPIDYFPEAYVARAQQSNSGSGYAPSVEYGSSPARPASHSRSMSSPRPSPAATPRPTRPSRPAPPPGSVVAKGTGSYSIPMNYGQYGDVLDSNIASASVKVVDSKDGTVDVGPPGRWVCGPDGCRRVGGADPMSLRNKTHVVGPGETLQKISQKYYGTTKQWKSIYDANRSALKAGPDRIQVGMRLTIP
jgi:nucleoid-associated protein YgaU